MKREKLVYGLLGLFGVVALFGDNLRSAGVKSNLRFDHVHFIVKNLDAALKSYDKLLGITPNDEGGLRRDSERSRMGMLPMAGCRLELIEPGASPNTRMSSFLKAHGEGVGGISFFVDEFDKEIQRLKQIGVPVEVNVSSGTIDPKYPFRVGWVEPDQAHGVWIEIVDAKAVPPYENEWFGQQRKNTRRFDHVHFIVKNLDEAMKSYEKLFGLTPTGKGGFKKTFQGGRIGMLPIHGARIEMIEPSGAPNDRMVKFLKERGEGVGGISVFVEDFDTTMKLLKSNGVAVEITTSTAIDPQYPFRMGWIEDRDAHGVWIEIVDAKAVPPYENTWDSVFVAPYSRASDRLAALRDSGAAIWLQ